MLDLRYILPSVWDSESILIFYFKSHLRPCRARTIVNDCQKWVTTSSSEELAQICSNFNQVNVHSKNNSLLWIMDLLYDSHTYGELYVILKPTLVVVSNINSLLFFFIPHLSFCWSNLLPNFVHQLRPLRSIRI